jgi:hypothetical protein
MSREVKVNAELMLALIDGFAGLRAQSESLTAKKDDLAKEKADLLKQPAGAVTAAGREEGVPGIGEGETTVHGDGNEGQSSVIGGAEDIGLWEAVQVRRQITATFIQGVLLGVSIGLAVGGIFWIAG